MSKKYGIEESRLEDFYWVTKQPSRQMNDINKETQRNKNIKLLISLILTS